MYASFLGRLGKDAELIETKSGKSFVKFAVAEDVYANGAKTTQWINCVDFRASTADKLIDFLKKGTQVFIVGESRIAKWEDNNGVERTNLECVVSNIKLAGSAGGSSEGARKNEAPKAASDKSMTFDDDDIAF